MELDDFKAQFNKATSQSPDHDILQIQKMIRNKSNSALHRFLHNFFMESLISIVVLIVLTWKIIHTLNTIQALFLLTAVVLMAGYQTYLFLPAYNELKDLSSDSDKPTRQWVDRVVELLDSFVSRYKRFMLWAMPVGFLIGCCFGFIKNDSIQIQHASDLFTTDFLLLLTVILVLTLFMYLMTWVYIKTVMNRLYTRYFTELKDYQKELHAMANG